ncbi:MAG: phosphate ABC transporter substrate-binding protein [Planctomycetota bacterium]
MTRMKTLSIVLALAMVATVAGAESKTTMQIEGSTTVGPIADAFAEAFMDEHDDVKVTVKKTGSGDGVAALIDDRCDIATASRFMKEGEFKKAIDNKVLPVAHVVAMDGVCVVLNNRNNVNALTTEQIRNIYLGKFTNWKQVGGPDLKIIAISRDTSSGTFETFHNLVMNKEKMHSSVETVASNPACHARVTSTAGAIAYVGLGFVDSKVKAVKVDGVMPNRRTVASGKFPIARPLFMFTNGYPKLGSLIHEFVTYHLTEKGQEIITAKGFVPLTNY